MITNIYISIIVYFAALVPPVYFTWTYHHDYQIPHILSLKFWSLSKVLALILVLILISYAIFDVKLQLFGEFNLIEFSKNRARMFQFGAANSDIQPSTAGKALFLSWLFITLPCWLLTSILYNKSVSDYLNNSTLGNFNCSDKSIAFFSYLILIIVFMSAWGFSQT
jgi:hypothetical protein